MLSHAVLVTRIVSGAALGGVIGYERYRHGRPAGLRTHVIVAMAAATFMVVSSQFVYLQGYGKDDLVAVDSSRIAASVVSGIGFLAGGAILRSGANVQGLTTAAGLWLVTAIGLCTGSGMFVEAGVVTGLGVLALVSLRRLEKKDGQPMRRRVTIVLGDGAPSTAELEAAIKDAGGTASAVEYDRHLDEKKRVTISLDLRVPGDAELSEVLGVIERQPGVRRVRVRAEP